MSKSYRNTIELGLVGDALRKRVMEIVTDSASMADPKDPSGSTIVALYRLVASEAEVRQMEEEFRAGGVGYSTFKRRLFETLEAYFALFRARRDALAREPGAVDRLLQNGAEQARTVATQTMARVRLAVGIE
jgi:tryptophanyl-tRNA synthetase